MKPNVNILLLCNRMTEGLFGKINIEEAFFGNELSVYKFPYILEITVCVDIPNVPISTPIKLELWENDKLNKSEVIIQELKKDTKYVAISVPFKIKLNEEGEWSFKIKDSKDSTLCERGLKIFKGDSPYLRDTGTQGVSAIVGPATSQIPLSDVVNRSLKHIVIIDTYPSANDWYTILQARQDVKIRVIIGRDGSKTECETLKSQLKDFEYKILKNSRGNPYFHDRFLIVDDTEFYHIGQSLKDIGKSVGRFSRLIEKNEIEDLRKHISSQWPDIYK